MHVLRAPRDLASGYCLVTVHANKRIDAPRISQSDPISIERETDPTSPVPKKVTAKTVVQCVTVPSSKVATPKVAPQVEEEAIELNMLRRQA